MLRSRTFGRKLAVSFALTVAFTLVIAMVAIYMLHVVAMTDEHVVTVNAQNLIAAEKLRVASAERSAAARGFILTKDQHFLDQVHEANDDVARQIGVLRKRVSNAADLNELDATAQLADAQKGAIDAAVADRNKGASVDSIALVFETSVLPKAKALSNQIAVFESHQGRQMEDGRNASSKALSSATMSLVAIGVIAVLFATGLALFLGRMLMREIGSAVQHVRSSSAELQAAANQQATGAKEQAASTNEITTTISELLASSRQIAESAQRVANVANETSSAAHAGDGSVRSAQESITGIDKQVESIVAHMLELAEKSRQVSSVLEIIDELSEQTNILAINAMIEAVGAGEAGKRFAVVADEIRKLADRVSSASKEIRDLIEEVRAAVNTTVMATESGSKAVATGVRQFDAVAASFTQIVGLISTTSGAAREIELTTKQQATAIEQVNVAISDVADVARETAASSGQTLQTASQLTEMSRGLAQLIQANGAL